MKLSVHARFFLCGLAVITLFFTSCKSEDQVKANIPMKCGDVTFVIPATTSPGHMLLTDQNVKTSIDSILEANGTDREHIRSVTIKTLRFSVLDGDTTNNLRLFESAKAYMKAPAMQDYVTIGEVAGNPDIVRYNVALPVNSTIDYAQYLTGDAFTFKLTGVTRAPVIKSITVKVDFDFEIEAGL